MENNLDQELQFTLSLNFYQVGVEIHTNSKEIHSRLSKDFSYFTNQKDQIKIKFKINCFLNEIPWDKLPALSSVSQNAQTITYQQGKIRYNNYHGEALSIYDYTTNQADVYSPSIDRLHEISYLIALSRSGKSLDLMGFHKIHAMGISFNQNNKNQCNIIMMPMKGGKSTLFMDLVQDPHAEIISDDTPLISKWGNVYPFPLRVGLEALPQNLSEDKFYTLERKQYGRKYLLPIEALERPIAKVNQDVRLIYAVRRSDDGVFLRPCSRWQILSPLFANLIIGIGLPMVLEYFLEKGFKDTLKRCAIIISRAMAALLLLLRARTYRLELGNDLKKNREYLINSLKK
jgi:hypothetical protein